MKRVIKLSIVSFLILAAAVSTQHLYAQALIENKELDNKVINFLSKHEGQWRDMNVPTSDAKLLYDLILDGKYTSALEIGTSTGYSGIYIAWALSKTGGKLITVDIDERRHKIAVKNFKEAGLSEYIDARLADAHQLVKELDGPFDFVFSDADKNWYKNYFVDVDPKLKVGGCYTTHNIFEGRRSHSPGYYEFVKDQRHYKTSLNSDGGGLLISYKTAPR